MVYEKLINLTYAIFSTRDVEMDCAACDAEMAHLAELVSAGGDPAELLPAVYAHLQRCGACREDYEALLNVLNAERAGLLNGDSKAGQNGSS